MHRPVSNLAKRHILVDILAVLAGSFLVDTFHTHSVVSGLLAAAFFLFLVLRDNSNLHKEEGKCGHCQKVQNFPAGISIGGRIYDITERPALRNLQAIEIALVQLPKE